MNEPSNLTLDEILSVPGNRAVYNALVSSLSDGEAIAFVGAGASAGMYPLWGEFLNLLADHAVAEGKATPRDAARWKDDLTLTPQQRVNIIVKKLGEPRYRNFLKVTFAPRRGTDGKPYMATHAALLGLPFSGYVTTNYDPALDYARAYLRPGSLITSTPTWRDDEEVYRWYTGDIFGRAGDCPILWLHGYWQRPNDIVLNSGEYSTAYKPGLYRTLFNALWGQRKLVFVGFGFNDPQFTFMVGEYLRDLRDINALPRHIALLGMPAGEDGRLPDAEAVIEWRDSLEDDYHVRPLFYPTRDGDHSALQSLLDAVAEECGRAAPADATAPTSAVAAAETPSIPTPDFAANWFHEPTNDDKFVGREDEIAHLDRWVHDDAVRAIGVSAVGGTGKTALVGHWLKNTEGWRSRPFAGLFAWSFYHDNNTSRFLLEFFNWAHDALRIPKLNPGTNLVEAAFKMPRDHALIIVLDGLEVLQEGKGEARYGTFLDSGLRGFLSALCQRDHRSLAVLTSRFVFADLYRFLGTAFHQLELSGLLPEQGAELLDELGVGGPAPERAQVSRRLDGHPLMLRIFAGALPDKAREQPHGFLNHVFRSNQVPEGAPLNDKLHRLLVFYENRLSFVEKRLLYTVALFRTPVADEAVLRLALGLFGGRRKEYLPDDVVLIAALKRLHTRGILTREPIEGGYGSACHPILRDYFRAVLLDMGTDTVSGAADLLKGQPSRKRPRSIKELERVLLAIGLLLDVGQFGSANELYRTRLENGLLFLWLPAPAEGLACTLRFVRDEERRQQCEKKLSRRDLRFYLNNAGLFNLLTGHCEQALDFYTEHAAICREMDDLNNLSVGLQHQSELMVALGQMANAQRAAAEALQFAKRKRDMKGIRSSHVCRGWAMALSGHSRHAAQEFALANEWEKRYDADGNELYSSRGIKWAELLVRAGHAALARRHTRLNLRICESFNWNHDIALCHWMLGWCALAEGRIAIAGAELCQAEPILHRGQLIFWLARLHVTAAELALACGDAAGAAHQSAEALGLAAPRGIRLIHADALVLRGRARMLEGGKDCAGRALDDAEEALRLAHECGYVWAERDARSLSAESHAARAAVQAGVGNAEATAREHEAARRARADAEALAVKLVLTEEDLAAAGAKAVAWLKEWEEEDEVEDDEDKE